MKIFGTNKIIIPNIIPMRSFKRNLLFFIILIFPILSFGQTGCDNFEETPFPKCNCPDCGELFTEWSPITATACEGEPFQLTGEESKPQALIEDYHWYFIDGLLVDGPFINSTPEITYTYQRDSSNPPDCDDETVSLEVTLIITSLPCPDGESCKRETEDLTVYLKPVPFFNYEQQVCVNDDITFQNESCHASTFHWDFGDGTTSNSSSSSINHSYDSTGTYTVTLTASNDNCNNSATYTQQIEVIGYPEASFDYTIDPTSGCEPLTVAFDNQSNQWSLTSWNISPFDTNLWCFTDTMMNFNTDNIETLFKESGDYEVMLTASNICATDQVTEIISVLETPFFSINPAIAGCDILTVSSEDLNFLFGGEITEICWNFSGNSTGPSNLCTDEFVNITFEDDGTITLNATSPCWDGDSTIVINVDIIPSEVIDLTGNATSYCPEGIDQLEALPEGGTWSSADLPPGSLSPNGILDLNIVTPGDYILVYTLGPGTQCLNEAVLNIEVLAPAPVTLANERICISSAPINLQSSDTGGVYIGPGIINSIQGTFDPMAPGVIPGINLVTYQVPDSNNCISSTEAIIQVDALPVVMLSDTASICLSDFNEDLATALHLNIDSTSSGIGHWSGDGVIVTNGIFNPQQAGLDTGFYTVNFTYERFDCIVSDSATIELIENRPLELSPEDTLCIYQDFFQLDTNLPGGIWDGPGVNGNTGLINLQLAGDGSHIYNYVFEEGSSCEQREEVGITIEDPSQGLDAGLDISLCEGFLTYQLTGESPIGGIWQGTALSDSGLIDLTQLVVDSVYTYRYCFASTGLQNCEACAERSFVINSNPIADYEIVGNPCINQTFQLVNYSSSPDLTDVLTYQWNMGDGGPILTTESPGYSYSLPGTYTISLEVTTSDNCSDVFSQTIYITTPATADFSLDTLEGCAPFLVQAQNLSDGDSILQYIWYIAGDTIIGNTPGNYFIDGIFSDSIFNIVLEVQNICGSAFHEQVVLVHPYPIVEFGISQDEDCSPVTIEFTNETLGAPDTFIWLLDGQLISTEREPEDQTFMAEDSIENYTVTLISENECGVDTLHKIITVYPPDIEAFIEQDTLAGCQPLTIQLESVSTPGSIISWLIIDEAGNTQGSILEDPLITLDSAGWHTIILAAEGAVPDCGTDFDTAYILVYPAPEVTFKLPDFACVGDTVFFENNSIDVSQSNWDFGDGNSSNNFSPFHVFNSSDTFSVSLTAYSINQQCPGTIAHDILIVDNPIANFAPSSLQGCEALTVEFDNLSTDAESYQWDFGDSTSIAFEEHPTHTFEKAGNYTVRLVAFNDYLCSSDTAVYNIFVFDRPESHFTFDAIEYCHRYDSLYLVDQSIDAVSWTWYFQEDTFNIPDPVLLPSSPGSHDITLVVKNNHGCPDTSVQQINILESPIAEIESLSPLYACPDFILNLQNLSQYSDSYIWDLGDGNTSTDFEPIDLVYQDSGTYSIILTSINLETNCPNDVDSLQIKVWPAPDASFSFEKTDTCGAPMEVQFTNNSQDNLDNDWTLGDGTSAQNTNVLSHVYTQAGDYDVSLIIENEFGCPDTSKLTLSIYEQPIAGFDLSKTIACEGEEIILSSTSQFANEHQWLITSYPEQNNSQIILYPEESGIYEITLIVKYNEQCQDTLTIEEALQVYDIPLADFTYSTGNLENIIGDVQFTNLSFDADRYFWDFGDGQGSEDVSPIHEYDINRDITVNLIAYNDNEGVFTCIDSISKPIAPEWIKSFYAPNAFSPGYGDQTIQVFRPTGFGIKGLEVWIYSPWGDLVWYSTTLEYSGPAGAWDGTYKGEELPQGAYVWSARVVYVDDSVERKRGTVMLLR